MRLVLVLCALWLVVPVQAGVIVADLQTDYVGGIDQAANPNGIPGLLSGHWHYFQDTDGNPANGNSGYITYRALNAGTYGYTGPYGWLEFYWPWISPNLQWEYPNGPPPDHSLVGHPGPGNAFLAIQYVADRPIGDLSIDYRFDKPNTYWDVSVAIVRGNGALLGSWAVGAPARTVSGTLDGLGSLSSGESIWLMLGAGSYGDASGDQSFLRMTLNDNAVPEPSLWLPTAAFAAAALVQARRRRWTGRRQ